MHTVSAKLKDKERLERERAARFAALDKLREATAGVPVKEIERKAACASATARADMRAEREQRAGKR